MGNLVILCVGRKVYSYFLIGNTSTFDKLKHLVAYSSQILLSRFAALFQNGCLHEGEKKKKKKKIKKMSGFQNSDVFE